MIEREVKVTWVEERYVPDPIEYTSNPTDDDIKEYWDTKEKAKIRHYGIILDFETGFFTGTKAIIDSGDNKIVKVPIEKLTVVHKPKKK